MEKVTGVGGVFFKSKDPKILGEWYAKHLGVPVEAWGGAAFPWRDANAIERTGTTTWSLFKADTEYFLPSTAPFMINLRVTNLEAMRTQLRDAGVWVDEKTDSSDFGRFGWALDPEGNRIELWEPPASERRGLACHVVDAFTREPFHGNPAAVVPLDSWLDDATLQNIALENHLSETAFFVARNHDGPLRELDLRWLTPTTEVELCGHATLASAFYLFGKLGPAVEQLRFHTKSGPLDVRRGQDGALVMDFPARPPVRAEDNAALATALGKKPRELWQSGKKTLALFDSADDVRALRPDMSRLMELPEQMLGVIATAPGGGQGVDFVSRFFTPRQGVPEDPVTGSAHTVLGPFYAARLNKTVLQARQVSARGGELVVELKGDRVWLTGHAVLTQSAVLHV